MADVTRHSPRQNQGQGLQQAMAARGRTFIGTAYTNRNDGSEQNIIRNRNEFGSITPENAMKWGNLQPNRGQFNWGQADQVAQYAQQNGKFLRCHALVVRNTFPARRRISGPGQSVLMASQYHDQLPNWVGNGQWNNQTLIQVMTTHITTVMQRYKGRCKHWDVVNEGEWTPPALPRLAPPLL